MLKTGILNPKLNELLSHFRHTNTIVIADAAFPFWPTVPTVDLALIDDLPRVLEVLGPIREACFVGKAWMAQEFLNSNATETVDAFGTAFDGVALIHEPHNQFKLRVPHAIGLIRTGDTIPYGNMVLESA